MHDNSNIILSSQFADFDVAMKMKQIGFNEPCLRYYDKDGKQCQSVCMTQYQYNEQVCSAPLWNQVMDFISDKLFNTQNLTKENERLRFVLTNKINELHRAEIVN